MGIASGDADNDGDEDLFVTNIIGETFALYENDGKANFEDARSRWSLAQPTAPFTGFGTEWIDYDNDGALDLFATNGAVNVIESQRGQPSPFRMKNLLFHNGGTRRFANVSGEAGPAFALDYVGRGAAFGDLDNDGDTDIVVTNNNGPVRLLLNEAARGAHWAADPAAAGWLAIATASAPGSASSARSNRHCGGGYAPMAAICPQATCGRTSGWGAPRRSAGSSSDGPTGRASDGVSWMEIA